jgi:hypothetical protein
MKVEFTVNGMLTIIAENDIEGYALQNWSEKNVNKNTPGLTVVWSPDRFKLNNPTIDKE